MINPSLLTTFSGPPGSNILSVIIEGYGYLRKKGAEAQGNQPVQQQNNVNYSPSQNMSIGKTALNNYQTQAGQSTQNNTAKHPQPQPKPMVVPDATPIVGKEATVPATDINVQGGEVAKPVSPVKSAELQKGLADQLTAEENNILSKAEKGYTDYQDQVNKIYDRLDEINKEADPTKRATYGQEQRILQNQLNVAETASANIAEDLESNRKLTGEMKTLLEESQRIMDTASGSPVAMSVLRSIEGRTIQDVQARAGILSAVMTANTQNIDQARNVIKDAGDTVKSHWKDRVDFIESVKKLKLDRGLKILDADEKKLDVQLAIAKGKMDRVDKAVQKVQDLMTDPKTAKLIANAGITLNDTLESINKKMAKEVEKSEAEEKRKTIVETATTNALKNGAPASVIAQLKSAKDWADVAKVAGPYIDKYERAKMQAEINAKQMDTRKTLFELAKAGDPSAISSLGYDPSKKENAAVIESTNATFSSGIDTLNRMVSNVSGLKGSSGAVQGTWSSIGSSLKFGLIGLGKNINDRKNFLSDLRQITSTEGFRAMAQRKAEGINLTPLSEGDRKALFDTAGGLNSMLQTDENGNITGLNASEDRVLEEVVKLRGLYMKAVDANTSKMEDRGEKELSKSIFRQ